MSVDQTAPQNFERNGLWSLLVRWNSSSQSSIRRLPRASLPLLREKTLNNGTNRQALHDQPPSDNDHRMQSRLSTLAALTSLTTQRQARTLPDTAPPYRRRPLAPSLPLNRCGSIAPAQSLPLSRCPDASALMLPPHSCRPGRSLVAAPLSMRRSDIRSSCVILAAVAYLARRSDNDGPYQTVPALSSPD
jgi:hypothetical protein